MNAVERLVLVIDDEEPVLKVASEILTYLGYRTETSSSGEEGIRRLTGPPTPDLVILDIIMPGMDGVTAYRTIRKSHPDLPVVISSGFADRASFQVLAAEGVAGFVNKPYHIEDLERELKRILG